MTEPSAMELADKIIAERRGWRDDGGRLGVFFNGTEMDMIVAALRAPASEPVAWTNEAQLGFLENPEYARMPMAMWSKRDGEYADIPLYAAPVPQPEGTQAREAAIEVLTIALEQAREAFDYAETKDDHLLCEARYRTFENALATIPSSPAPVLRSLNSGESEPVVMPTSGAGEAISPADLAEVLENVKAGIAAVQAHRRAHDLSFDVPVELHKACHALAHMTRPC